ncbi:MAG: hypothetical protein U0T69_08660 [Chitinophagales bacterium]
MFDSKLIQTYIAFSAEEKRKIRKWMNNRNVNGNDDVLLFFQFIESRKNITPKTVTKLKVHEYLYPNTAFNDLRIRHLIWLTNEVFESFIIHVSVEKQLGLKEKLLSQFYIDKGLLTHANKTIEDAIELVTDTSLKNSEFYRNIYDLDIVFYDINSRNNRNKDFKVNESIRSFTVYTIVEVLKSACIVNTIQRVMEFEAQQYLLQSVLELLPNSDFLQIPIVRIYYNTYLVVSNEDETAFEIFITDIKQNEVLFSMQDLSNLYRSAINFCIKKSNQNIEYYSRKSFELYLYTIENGIFIENGEINRYSFTNTISLGIKLKEFTKIETFTKQYSTYINIIYRKNTIDFNTAKVFYAKDQHEKALRILLTNEFKDSIWNLNAKYLVLKILFELRNIELLEIHLKAFKTYIKRKANIGYHKTYFTNVCNALYQLIDIYKNPAKYINYVFDKETPDIEWFNKSLLGLHSIKKK